MWRVYASLQWCLPLVELYIEGALKQKMLHAFHPIATLHQGKASFFSVLHVYFMFPITYSLPNYERNIRQYSKISVRSLQNSKVFTLNSGDCQVNPLRLLVSGNKKPEPLCKGPSLTKSSFPPLTHSIFLQFSNLGQHNVGDSYVSLTYSSLCCLILIPGRNYETTAKDTTH